MTYIRTQKVSGSVLLPTGTKVIQPQNAPIQAWPVYGSTDSAITWTLPFLQTRDPQLCCTNTVPCLDHSPVLYGPLAGGPPKQPCLRLRHGWLTRSSSALHEFVPSLAEFHVRDVLQQGVNNLAVHSNPVWYASAGTVHGFPRVGSTLQRQQPRQLQQCCSPLSSLPRCSVQWTSQRQQTLSPAASRLRLSWWSPVT